MAVNEEKSHSISATGRHWLFGTNVTVLIVLVLFIVVAVNWAASSKLGSFRADLSAGGPSSYRLSQRTQNLLKQAPGDVVITTVYTSDEPDYKRETYFPRLEDLCDEMAQVDKRVKIQHLHTGEDRAELRDRIQGKFGPAAEKHEEVVKGARELWNGLGDKLGPVQKEIELLQQDEAAWLSNFSTLARITAKLKANLKDVQDGQRELDELVGSQTIPQYQQATDKIKTIDDQLKQTLDDVQKWCKDINALATVLSNSNSEFATKSRQQIEAADKQLKALTDVVGNPEDQTVPDDPKPLLEGLAKPAAAFSRWLADEGSRLSAFAKANPAIEQHPHWFLNIEQPPLVITQSLPDTLSKAGQLLNQVNQGVRANLARTDIQTFDLQRIVKEVRRFAGIVSQEVNVYRASLQAVLDDGSKIDPKSKQFLTRGSDGSMFKETIDKLAEIGKKIGALPKLELDEIARRLQEDNLVVVEANSQVRVVKFDEAWPVSDPTAGRFRPNEKQATARVFDGDNAIAGALLSMVNQKKFATVVFVAYEIEADPRMRQMGQGGKTTGRIPLDQLDTLKDKLKQANFAVGKDWNLAAEGEEAKPPQPEEGTDKIIYVFLPPAETPPPNPMMGRPPEKGFGKEQLDVVKQRLTAGSKAIFLAHWEMPRMSWFGPEPSKPYAYNELLEDEFGIDVKQDYRLLRVVPDERDPDRYSIDIEQFECMQLSSFTGQPIGAPLKSRRMLMDHVCPVVKYKGGQQPLPEGVTVTPVLEVPEASRTTWAEKTDGIIGRISDALRTGENRGQFPADPVTTWLPPFSVILAAEKSVPQSEKSRVVVMGNGMSFADYYMTRRVPRFSGEGRRTRFVTDPPPMENADLFINAVYWLNGQEGMIAEGPAELPLVPPLRPGTQNKVLIVTVVWAFLVLIAGGIVWQVRRK